MVSSFGKLQVYKICPLWGFFFFLFLGNIEAQDQRIRLLFAGDIMGHIEQIESAAVVEDEFYDYTSCFRYVKPLIQSADLAIANLEVTLPGQPPYQGFPYFKSPDDLALALKHTGFDVLLTANNHSNDDNKRGLIHTVDFLQKNHIYQTGTFRNQRERDLFYPLIVYKNGFKLAFLNCTFSTNKRATKPPTIVNMLDEKQIRSDIEEAKKLNADFVIVTTHWGREYELEEHFEQERLAKLLFKWGADLVIGSHPHVVQPIKYVDYKFNKEKKKGLVVYSLGNFISNQSKLDTDGGIMVEVELRKNETSPPIIEDVSYIPVWRYIEADNIHGIKYYVLPIDPLEQQQIPIHLSAEHRKAMALFAARTRKRLENAPCKEKRLSKEFMN